MRRFAPHSFSGPHVLREQPGSARAGTPARGTTQVEGPHDCSSRHARRLNSHVPHIEGGGKDPEQGRARLQGPRQTPGLDAAEYAHPNVFPPVPTFDGRDIDAFHAQMVVYNDIIRGKRRARQTKDSGVWEKHMKLYASALHAYNAAMEARNRHVLLKMGGWRLPISIAGGYTRRDVPGVGSHTAFTLSPLVSATVAQRLTRASERIGYRELVIRLAKSERSNTRCIVSDEGLASALWELIRREIPTQLQSAEGTMVPYCVSPRFRFCRYEAGQLFAAHKDDRYRNSSSSLASLLTLVVYLNEDFTGGKLNFLRRPWPAGTTVADRERDMRGNPKSRNTIAQVTPRTGLAAVFSQALLHEGSPLTSGVKYLVRTDIVYKARGRHVPKVHMDRLLPFDSVA